MDAKFRYELDAGTGVLFKYYYGDITIEDIESSWEYAFDSGLITEKVKGFVLDYREATFDMNPSEYILIANFYRSNLKVFRGCRIGIITHNPRDIVIPVLVETKDDGYSSRPFTTPEAAIAWVLGF